MHWGAGERGNRSSPDLGAQSSRPLVALAGERERGDGALWRGWGGTCLVPLRESRRCLASRLWYTRQPVERRLRFSQRALGAGGGEGELQQPGPWRSEQPSACGARGREREETGRCGGGWGATHSLFCPRSVHPRCFCPLSTTTPASVRSVRCVAAHDEPRRRHQQLRSYRGHRGHRGHRCRHAIRSK